MSNISTTLPDFQTSEGTSVLHVQQYTVIIEDEIVHEIQQVEARPGEGQTLRGTFQLSFLGKTSIPLKVDISAADMKYRLEQTNPYIGDISVTRTGFSVSQGFVWTITFQSRVGNQPQLKVDDSGLTDPNTQVIARTIQDGISLHGTWELSKGNQLIGEFSVSVSSEQLEDTLLAKLRGFSLSSAQVSRSSFNTKRPLSCVKSFCLNNEQADYLDIVYTITLAWETWSTVYRSSENVVRSAFESREGQLNSPSAILNVTIGHIFSEFPELGVGLPDHKFTHLEDIFLGYGGTGGTNAGRGGFGHSVHESVTPPSFDTTRLAGGAGGSIGGEIPQQILPFLSKGIPPGLGGSGGGVLELFAINDITIGVNGSISANGGSGMPAYRGGGGGAGGSVRMVSSGTVRLDASVTASGGNGGHGMGLRGKGGGGGGGGFLGIAAQAVLLSPGQSINVNGGARGVDGLANENVSSTVTDSDPDTRFQLPSDRQVADQNGATGLLQQFTRGNIGYTVEPFGGGAADTRKSLRVEVSETVISDSGETIKSPSLFNGPVFTFKRNDGVWSPGLNISNPERPVKPALFSIFVKSGKPSSGNVFSYQGLHVALIGSNRRDSLIGSDGEILMGMAIINGRWFVGSNYRGSPSSPLNASSAASVVNHPIEFFRWYKLDFFISWANNTFTVRIDDETVVVDFHFDGLSLQHLGLFQFDAGISWFDEIYAGPEFTMGFECPLNFPNSRETLMNRPVQSVWRDTDLGPDPLYGVDSQPDNITRHSNHLSNEDKFTHPFRDGLIFGDGKPHDWYDSNVQRSTLVQNRKIRHGDVSIGNLNFVPGNTVSNEIKSSSIGVSNDLGLSAEKGAGAGDSSLTSIGSPDERAEELTRHAADSSQRFRDTEDYPNGLLDGYGRDWNGKTGRWYWYGEHDNFLADENLNGVPLYLSGGIGGCSTNDFITWRNEGIALHFINITDDVYGGQTIPDKSITGIHEAFGVIEKYRMDYANALSPYWNKSQTNVGKSLDLETLRTEQGAVWDPRSNILIPAQFDVVFNLSAFPNSEIICPNETLLRNLDGGEEHLRYIETLTKLCDNDVNPEVQPALNEETSERARYVGGKHSLQIPNLCYFFVTVNHSMLGFVSPEEIKEARNGVFVNNTLYYVSNASIVVDEGTHRSFEGTITQFFVVGTRFFINGTYDEVVGQYIGGTEVLLQCPEIKRFFYRAERPKVVYNPYTEHWVMWMQIDDTYQQRRLAGVATSLWPSGPFTFAHSLLPDGNETVDLTIISTFDHSLDPSNCTKPDQFVADDDCSKVSFLARTYYATKSYLMPLPIMQPVWESVKDEHGNVNFAANFHRALYAAGYDNPDDIYKQRWRMEDKQWQITVKKWIERFDSEGDVFTLTNRDTSETFSYKAEERADFLRENLDGETLADITGQGQNLILSKFINPRNLTNSAWTPGSVPAIKTQPWHRNYADKNIADNPVHPTIADLLIGPLRPVLYRRTKYVAISQLNEEYTDTTSVIRVIEGELMDDQQLNSLQSLDLRNPFGWEPGNLTQTTFPEHIISDCDPFNFSTNVDWYDRHHQYSAFFGDREDDFRNFRDRQLNTSCQTIHHRLMAKQNECEIILNEELQYEFSEPQTNYRLEEKSFARGMDTRTYEECLAQHKSLLLDYEACVHDFVPEAFTDDFWTPNSRECVGGGGRCGPPPEGELPRERYPQSAKFTFSREYNTMTNVYKSGGPPFERANLEEFQVQGERMFQDNEDNRKVLAEYEEFIHTVQRPVDEKKLR